MSEGKKPAHENLMDANRALKFPGRLNDKEREEALNDLVTQCMARKNDIIPGDIIEPLCQELLRNVVNCVDLFPEGIWEFVVSQMEDEGLAIILLEEVANDIEEG